MAVGWSPLGSYSDTSLKATPPSDFSGRSRPVRHELRQAARHQRMRRRSSAARPAPRAPRSERSCGLARMAFSDAVMSPMLREGGPVLRSAGKVDGLAGRNGACGASAKPCAVERLVSGVPPAPSAGGAGGLPDLPREGRGRGWCPGRFGGAGHGGDIWRGVGWQLSGTRRLGRLLTSYNASVTATEMGGELLNSGMRWTDRRNVQAWRSEPRLARLSGRLRFFAGRLRGFGPWAIAVAAIALASVSRAQYSYLYERSRDLGLRRSLT